MSNQEIKTNARVSRKVPLHKIDPPAIRDRSEISNEEIAELANSIRAVGLVQPIVLNQRGKRYEVVAGHRRFIACTSLDWFEVPAYILGPNDDVSTIRYIENRHRSDISAWDDATALTRIVAKNPTKSRGEIAEMLGLGLPYLSQRLAILKYPVILQDALKAGHVAFSVARELSQIKDLDHLKYLIIHAEESGCSPATARMWRQQWQNMQAASLAPAQEDETGDLPNSQPAIYLCECCRESFADPALISPIFACRSCHEDIKAAMLLMRDTEKKKASE